MLIPDAEGARSYPIATFSWALVYDRYPDPAKAQSIQGLLCWSLTEAEGMG